MNPRHRIHLRLLRLTGNLIAAGLRGDNARMDAIQAEADNLHTQLDALKDRRP